MTGSGKLFCQEKIDMAGGETGVSDMVLDAVYFLSLEDNGEHDCKDYQTVQKQKDKLLF